LQQTRETAEDRRIIIDQIDRRIVQVHGAGS